MDFFLIGTVLFLMANVAVVISMLRRVNLHNDSVLAWEQQHTATVHLAPVQTLPRPAFDSTALPEAA